MSVGAIDVDFDVVQEKKTKVSRKTKKLIKNKIKDDNVKLSVKTKKYI